jgi:glyoxylase-like metal-dependent hydrolase (beta-lactamase superfamily II)
MYRTPAAAVLLLALMLTPAAPRAQSKGAQEARAVVAAALKSMGAEGLQSITYSGAAAQGNFGQSRTISFGLASTSIRDYVRTIDFTQPASRATGITLPPAVEGEPPPQPGTYNQTITPANAAWAQQMHIWVTPWGFLRGAAAAAEPSVRSRKIDGVQYQVVTWSPAQKAPSGADYRVIGYISPDNVVDRVETWVDHPVLGDMHVELFYTGYRTLNGLMVPTRVAQRQVGMEMFVADIRQAQANPPNLAALMAPPASAPQPAPAPAPTPAAVSERLADGVYRITGGYVALAVEFKDYILVLEGGQSEARGLAIIEETKRLFPNKRIRYVVNTHPHLDHAAGLAPFVAEGVTIIAADQSRYYLEQALASPRTLVGDTLAKSRRRPKVEGVLDRRELKDATRTLLLHRVERLEHSDAMLIAYLPAERILFTADFAIPQPGQPAGASLRTLADTIERLNLDFDRHVPVHPLNPDRLLTKPELLALARGAK